MEGIFSTILYFLESLLNKKRITKYEYYYINEHLTFIIDEFRKLRTDNQRYNFFLFELEEIINDESLSGKEKLEQLTEVIENKREEK